MSKRFIVAINSSTPQQDLAFKEYARVKGIGWWHWLNNVWLLYTYSDDLTATQLRDDLGEIYPNIRKLVLELSEGSDTWAGFGPTGAGRSMFAWIRENWHKER